MNTDEAPRTAEPMGVRRLDLDQPNAARMYDYYLGGSHNTSADRTLAERVLAADPRVRAVARANRSFLRRVVRLLVAGGIRQFLDLGSGIPTAGHVHEIAHTTDPDVRVAYVDNEPVAVSATRRLITDQPNVTVTAADLRDVDTVLTAPGVRDLLDFREPVAVLAFSVMHFLPDEADPAGVLAAYRAAIAPGSYLAFSHIAPTGAASDSDVTSLYKRSSNAAWARTPAEIAALVPADMPLLAPGLVPVVEWRPDDLDLDDTSVDLSYFYGGLAHLPH
ncbi:MAG TPA: SAM-dependent methyltransferase [Pseudonocardiaceae bacterium]|nr:SAM-dependent methyltransferase [Pseudonocardiaceae bacterium]